MPRAARTLIAAALGLALAGCGGASTASKPPVKVTTPSSAPSTLSNTCIPVAKTGKVPPLPKQLKQVSNVDLGGVAILTAKVTFGCSASAPVLFPPGKYMPNVSLQQAKAKARANLRARHGGKLAREFLAHAFPRADTRFALIQMHAGEAAVPVYASFSRPGECESTPDTADQIAGVYCVGWIVIGLNGTIEQLEEPLDR